MIGDAPEAPAPRLDLRGLDPPEPMRRALDAVEALHPGECVEILTDREPLLLQRELARRGHRFVSAQSDEGCRTTIARSKEADKKR